MDSVRVHLGGRFDQARYLARTDSAQQAVQACGTAATARRKERERRLGG